jgi:hypothetical protein
MPTLPSPLDGFVLRLATLGSSWVDGLYPREADARRRAGEMLEQHPEITGAYLWEYRHGQVVRCHRLLAGS